MLGISPIGKQAEAAWDFVAWTLSEEAQIEVMAKNKNITVRSDLASNPYPTQDPRLGSSTSSSARGRRRTR